MGTDAYIQKRKKWGLAVASVLVFAATLVILIHEGTKKTVALTLDGEKVVVKTHAETVGDMLDELDINVKEKDFLSHNPNMMLKDELSLVWEPAKKVNITDGDDSGSVWTTAKTVEQFLKEQQMELKEHDRINVSLGDQIFPNMNIEIKRAFPLVLKDGKNEKKVWSASATVGDLLEQEGITLGKWDRVKPGLDHEVSPDAVIHVIRVEKVTDTVKEPIPFEVVAKKDPSLPKGTEKVIREGKQGSIKKDFEVTKENGKEVKRKLVSEKIIENSTNKIVAVGTKEMGKQRKAKQPENQPASGEKELFMHATAYTAKCAGCSGVTATGIDLRNHPNAKVVAVDPNVIPLGSKVWVEGYGYAVAGDTGGAIKGNRIDVHVPTPGQANSFGRKQVKVKIIN
jgi:uncharacterized protein YabE (DUF348 family)